MTISIGEDGDDTLAGRGGQRFHLRRLGTRYSAGRRRQRYPSRAMPATTRSMAATGDDNLAGGDGNDVIIGGAPATTSCSGATATTYCLTEQARTRSMGDAGDDHVVAAADAADDTYDGGAGRDTLDYSAATESVTADLGAGTAEGSETGHDVIAGFRECHRRKRRRPHQRGSTSVAMSGGAGQ